MVKRVESNFHLFKDCHGLKALVFSSKWGGRSEAWPATNILELVEMCLNPSQSLCGSKMEKDEFTIFMVSLFYWFCRFQNKLLFEGKISNKDVGFKLDMAVSEFIGDNVQSYTPLIPKRKMEWNPPKHGWWKVNVNDAYVDGNATLALVVHDDDGVLVVACTKLAQMPSAWVAELRAIE